MPKKLSDQKVSDITYLLTQGFSTRHIAEETAVTHSVVSKIAKKKGITLPRGTGGRPSILSTTDKQYAMRLITSGKVDTAAAVARELHGAGGRSISAQTVCRGLKKEGLKSVVKCKCPLLSAKHRRARLDFAISHQYWTIDDWKRVVWSDETKINLLGSDGRKWAWKRPGEGLSDRLVVGTKKFGGGSLMMWGCMGWDGVGYACKINARMDADLYVAILEDELQLSLGYWGKTSDEVVFQQDNDPKHTSKKAKTWFNNHGFEVMMWPAQSPDLNPIEHLWFHLKRRLAGYPEAPKGITELWERVQKEWEDIDESVCQDLISSIPRRVEAVIRAKGGYTKY